MKNTTSGNINSRTYLQNFLIALLSLISLLSCNSGSTLSSSNAITAYSINGTAGVITGTNIVESLPYGTNLAALTATFTTTGTSVVANNIPQVSGTTPNNFSAPVIYTVTAANGATQTYTVTTTVATNSAKAITTYSINGVAGVITGTNITVNLPAGTPVTALVATYTTNVTRVTVNGVPQTSNSTANDFTNPVQYVITAVDGSTLTYTVTVIAPSNASAISAFSVNGTVGVISGTTITVALPFGASLASLVATFSASAGATVTVGTTPQISGTTINDFTNSAATPLQYLVTAADGRTTTTYNVSVTAALATANTLTSYSLNVTSPTTLITTAIQGVINGNNVIVNVPYGTNLSSLVANFTTTAKGAESVTYNGIRQISGVTANNFTNAATTPLQYTVVAADGVTAATYNVTVTTSSLTSNSITAFSLNGTPGIINGNNIAVTMPYGTSVTSLVANFTTSVGNGGVLVGSVTQTSGVTANNFTTPVVYTVNPAAGAAANSQSYYVSVSVAASTASSITSFALNGIPGVINTAVSPATISVTMPYGTSVTGLVATYTASGTVRVGVAGPIQTSGVTPNDFTTSPVIYAVTSSDGTVTTQYQVMVSVAPQSANAITAFSVNGVAGVINGTNITVTMPFGTVISSVVPNFITSGGVVSVSGATQISGFTPESFPSSGSLPYIVTAANGSTVQYNVAVTATQIFNNPTSITFNPAGTMAFITNAGNNTVTACNLVNSGTTLNGCVSTGATTLSSPAGLAFNESGTFAYIVNLNNSVSVCSVVGNVFSACVNSTLSTVSGARNITLNAANTQAYITGSSNNIVVACTISNFTSVINCANTGASGLSTPSDILSFPPVVVTPAPFIFIANAGNNSVSKCFISGSIFAGCASIGITATSSYGMAFNSTGTILYVANAAGTAASSNLVTACNINTTSGAASGCVISGTPVPATPQALALSPNGTTLFMANSASLLAACSVNGLSVSGCTYTGTNP